MGGRRTPGKWRCVIKSESNGRWCGRRERAGCLAALAAETLYRSELDRGQHPADLVADPDAAGRRIVDAIAEAMLEHLQPERDGFTLHVGKPAEFRADTVADNAIPI